MLTQIRTFGYVFNPVSFYYYFSRDERLVALVAEITNTPWRERHRYVLDGRDLQPGEDLHARFAMDFHVSPFFGMQQTLDWRFTQPRETLGVHMQNVEGEKQVFGAGMVCQRKEIGAASLAKTWFLYPLQTFRVSLGIYWHAGLLWLKKVPCPVHPKTNGSSEESVGSFRSESQGWSPAKGKAVDS